MAIAVSVMIGAGFGLGVYNWLFARIVVEHAGRRFDIIQVDLALLPQQIERKVTRRGGL